MAKVTHNIITQGLSGKLGNQIVFRTGRGGQTIVAVKPSYDPNRGMTSSQLVHQEAFRQAIAYAKSAKGEAAYIAKAQETTMTSFNAAVADWFKKPEVLEIDTSDWKNANGGTIRIKAQDDVLVTKVSVVLRDSVGVIKEQDEAVRADGLWWNYTTTQPISAFSGGVIVATAQDLAGNTTELIWQVS